MAHNAASKQPAALPVAYRHLEIDEPAPGVLRCAMSNPPTHTLVAAEVTELAAFAAEAEARQDVRVVVFTGGGKGIFIRHYEVGELAAASERRQASDAPPSQAATALHPLNRLTLALQKARFVTIAAMNGNAAGGGLEFALGCDFRLLADGDYRLGLPETGVGIIPGAGGTQRFARLLGVAKALELILHGTLLTPAAARELGIVHALLPLETFAEDAVDYARRLAERSPIGLAAAKAAIYRGAEGSLEAGLRIEQAQFGRCMESRDAAVAMRSVLNGEKWEWQGR